MTLVDSPRTVVPVGGPSLPQERRLVTAIPGPKSLELTHRKEQAISAGVGTAIPVYTVAAGGGVLVDVDGNSLIDLGSGIAVTGVGNSAPRVVDAVAAQLAQFTHTCFSVAPYDGYIEVAEALNRLTPGDHVKRTALFNSGAEAVENAVMFASDHEAIVPDLMVMAKGIAGGLPLSAVTGRAEIMDAPQIGGIGGTYGGNPLACAAALATIDSYETDNLVERAREIGAILTERL